MPSASSSVLCSSSSKSPDDGGEFDTSTSSLHALFAYHSSSRHEQNELAVPPSLGGLLGVVEASDDDGEEEDDDKVMLPPPPAAIGGGGIGAPSIDTTLFECHRALMSVRESVDTKYQELECRYQATQNELAEAKKTIADKDKRAKRLQAERDDALDELACERAGESALVRGMAKESAKITRKLSEARGEVHRLRRENDVLKSRFQELTTTASSTESGGVSCESYEQAPPIIYATGKQPKSRADSPFSRRNALGGSGAAPSSPSTCSQDPVRRSGQRQQRRLSGEKRPSWFRSGNADDAAGGGGASSLAHSASNNSLSSLHNSLSGTFSRAAKRKQHARSASSTSSDRAESPSLRMSFTSKASLMEERVSNMWESMGASLQDEEGRASFNSSGASSSDRTRTASFCSAESSGKR